MVTTCLLFMWQIRRCWRRRTLETHLLHFPFESRCPFTDTIRPVLCRLHSLPEGYVSISARKITDSVGRWIFGGFYYFTLMLQCFFNVLIFKQRRRLERFYSGDWNNPNIWKMLSTLHTYGFSQPQEPETVDGINKCLQPEFGSCAVTLTWTAVRSSSPSLIPLQLHCQSEQCHLKSLAGAQRNETTIRQPKSATFR